MKVPTFEEIKEALEIPFKDGGAMTLQYAREKGLKWYFTGEPCSRGHVAQRLTANSKCRKCSELDSASRYRQGGKYD